MQNEYALRACRASAATRALKSGIRRQRPPVASEASGAASAASGVPKLVLVTGSVGFSTGAETCTSSATAEPVSR
jgi:hypothetical protein